MNFTKLYKHYRVMLCSNTINENDKLLLSELEQKIESYKKDLQTINNKHNDSISIKESFLQSVSDNTTHFLNKIQEIIHKLRNERVSENDFLLIEVENYLGVLIGIFDNLLILSQLKSEQYTLNSELCSASRIMLNIYSLVMHNDNTTIPKPNNLRIGQINNTPDEFIGDSKVITKILSQIINEILKHSSNIEISLTASICNGNLNFIISSNQNGITLNTFMNNIIQYPLRKCEHDKKINFFESCSIINRLLDITTYHIKFDDKSDGKICIKLIIPQ